MAITRAEHYRRRYQQLRSERSSMEDLWRDLSDHVLGFRGRFLATDRNKAKRNRKILNNTGRLAARTLASGMMAGITSPARPWFKLGTLDPDLQEYGPVRTWLNDVEKKMREVFNQSNVYNVLHSTYAELGTFGTAAMGVFSDYENIIRCANYTVGSFWISADGEGVVDTFYRVYQMTTAQVVKTFGLDNCSPAVQNNWRRGNLESWVDILHVIEPNDDADRMKKGKMPYRSVYMELSRDNRDQFLRESQFKEFPIMVPRWDLAGDDIYGSSCPGMDALGDIKALQLHEKRKSQAIDKLVDPPLQAPVALQNQIVSGFTPGEVEFVPDTANGIRSIYDFRPDINALVADIKEDEARVKRAFYEDLFLMLAMSDRRQITAREVEERHEEKMLMLGPVLERIHNELLDPLITRTFNLMLEAGVLPPVPEEMNGTELNVEYISVLAQAQKLVAVAGIERVSTYAMTLAQAWPEARHKFDAMQAVDEYARAIGVPPSLVTDDDKAQQAVQAERMAQAAQQAVQAAPQVSKAAKDASETDIESVNALTRAMGLA